MIKQLAVECLLTQPKLNNLSDILMILADSEQADERLLAAKYLTKIFSFYWENHLITGDTPVSQFIWNKLISFGQLLIIRLLEDPTHFAPILFSLFRIEHQIKKTQLTQSVLEQIVQSSNDIIWQKITNGEVLTKLINELRKKEKVYHTKVAVLTGLNDKKVFVPYLTQEKDSKRQRDGSSVVQTTDNPILIQNFKKAYEGLLIDFLKDEKVPEEYISRLIGKLGESVYSKMESPLILSEYVVDKFLCSNSLETKVNALSGLYILIGKYGLELQNFYEKLLELITTKIQGKNLFENSKCKRIYRLIENALKSSKVPFKTVSSFIRILLEQILVQKSEFGCWAMALVFNIAKKHRNILNSITKGETYAEDSEQNELASLSQMQLMKSHYLPQVRSILNELNKNLSKVDFLDIDEISKLKLDKVLEKKIEELMEKQIEFELPEILHPLNL